MELELIQHNVISAGSPGEQLDERWLAAAGQLSAAGFLFARRGADELEPGASSVDAQLEALLRLDGPDMRPSRDYHDFGNVSLAVAGRAWRLLHEHARAAVQQRVVLARPVLLRALRAAKVSAQCERAAEATLEAAQQLRAWAVKLLASWGSLPFSAIFEGTYGDVGAFHTCVDIDNVAQLGGHAHYCSLALRPVLPSREPYAPILRREPAELAQMFEPAANSSSGERDALTELLEHAQYHHFVYYKWATCWPIACSPFDVRRVAKFVAHGAVLLNGPVKCYSKNSSDYEQPDLHADSNGAANSSASGALQLPPSYEQARKLASAPKLKLSIWDKNQGIFIWKPHFNTAHKLALAILVAVALLILALSLADLLANRLPRLWRQLVLALHARPLNSGPEVALAKPRAELAQPKVVAFGLLASGEQQPLATLDHQEQQEQQQHHHQQRWSLVHDCSLFTNVSQFFRVSEGQMKNDILCLNGIRCITMIWIIITHTMMYNDWSGFARTREVEKALRSLLSQPLFSGSYLVDTFFLMSGLLSSFTAFKHSQGARAKFNSLAFILGRWLRLTPQIFLVSLLYIVFPALSYGPHWFPIVGEYSENCQDNWWINVLHLQAFYKKEQMCNFVTWWISIDFFYHFFAMALIWLILVCGHKTGFVAMFALVGLQVAWQSIRHYQLKLPPNVLSTIPQTGAMWTQMTLNFFWTPYTHSVPFFFGFYIGYLMALKKKLIVQNLNTRRALMGWTLATGLLVAQSYSTYWWVTDAATYSPLVSTLYYGACSIIWAGSLCWIIIACHHGYGGFVNRLLSCKTFIVLGKASYLVYLSHFQILFIFFGNQNLLLEPTTLIMLYIIIGNIFLSTLWGIFLCSVFELPWLKTQRRLMKYV